ncbi:helix-turn-helix domain-containing protein [Desulfobacter curvatus]|uniref:helix-turn-helix domain-containing protein n=1 Tax=Desulfobacter curvatus TaxID=2290 RepID=UPI000362351F|nr:helix-turn-helix domain-containing protein [Desulfobacter curvatus]
MDSKSIGELIKTARKEQGFTQTEAAGYLNVGIRFLSELENGKPTVQLGKTLQVLEGLGYETLLVPKSKRTIINYVEKNLINE